MLCYTSGNNIKKVVCDSNNNTTNKKLTGLLERKLDTIGQRSKTSCKQSDKWGEAHGAQGVTEVREVQQSCRQTSHHMKLERLMLKTLPVMAAEPFPSK